MISLIETLRHIYNRVNQLFQLIVATLTLTETGGTLTTDGTEQDIYINNTPMGVFYPQKVMIDFSNQTVAETVVVRIYYRIKDAGSLRLKDQIVFEGVQALPLKNVELEPNRYGIQVTMERTIGGALAYDWEVFYRT